MNNLTIAMYTVSRRAARTLSFLLRFPFSLLLVTCLPWSFAHAQTQGGISNITIHNDKIYSKPNEKVTFSFDYWASDKVELIYTVKRNTHPYEKFAQWIIELPASETTRVQNQTITFDYTDVPVLTESQTMLELKLYERGGIKEKQDHIAWNAKDLTIFRYHQLNSVSLHNEKMYSIADFIVDYDFNYYSSNPLNAIVSIKDSNDHIYSTKSFKLRKGQNILRDQLKLLAEHLPSVNDTYSLEIESYAEEDTANTKKIFEERADISFVSPPPSGQLTLHNIVSNTREWKGKIIQLFLDYQLTHDSLVDIKFKKTSGEIFFQGKIDLSESSDIKTSREIRFDFEDNRLSDVVSGFWDMTQYDLELNAHESSDTFNERLQVAKTLSGIFATPKKLNPASSGTDSLKVSFWHNILKTDELKIEDNGCVNVEVNLKDPLKDYAVLGSEVLCLNIDKRGKVEDLIVEYDQSKILEGERYFLEAKLNNKDGDQIAISNIWPYASGAKESDFEFTHLKDNDIITFNDSEDSATIHFTFTAPSISQNAEITLILQKRHTKGWWHEISSTTKLFPSSSGPGSIKLDFDKIHTDEKIRIQALVNSVDAGAIEDITVKNNLSDAYLKLLTPPKVVNTHGNARIEFAYNATQNSRAEISIKDPATNWSYVSAINEVFFNQGKGWAYSLLPLPNRPGNYQLEVKMFNQNGSKHTAQTHADIEIKHINQGFHTVSGDHRLFDSTGKQFIMRGVNAPFGWDYDKAFDAIATIADLNTNMIRVAWEKQKECTPTKTEDCLEEGKLKAALDSIIDYKMVPMVEYHDITGSNSPAKLLKIAEDIASKKAIFRDDARIARHILINIANEWGDWKLGTDNNDPSPDLWFESYVKAINIIRAAGIHATLVIDGPDFAQSLKTINSYGKALIDADPISNVMFSVHMYANWSDDTGVDIKQALLDTHELKLPLVVGEFGHLHTGHGHNQGLLTRIDAHSVMKHSIDLASGYIAWSWNANGEEVGFLDMTKAHWKELNSWGKQVYHLSDYGITYAESAGGF